MAQFTRRAVLTSSLAASVLPFVRPAFGQRNLVPAKLQRGFNLPDWADRMDGIAPSAALLETLAHLGFGTVRLPIDPGRVLADPTGMARRISASLTTLHTHGFGVTLDLHPQGAEAELFSSAPADAAERMDRAWQVLAGLMADFPADSTFAELLNEPPMDTAQWLDVRERLAATVRRICPAHTIIWGAARYQGIWELRDQPVLADANSIAAVHYYWPIGFTHQCADWSSPELGKMRNLPFPVAKTDARIVAFRQSLAQAGEDAALAFLDREFAAEWAVAHIDQEFADLRAWSDESNCPVILNEFGVLNFCVDAQSRFEWVQAVRRAAEAYQVPWTYWELDRGFGFVGDRTNPDSVDYGLVAALMSGGG